MIKCILWWRILYLVPFWEWFTLNNGWVFFELKKSFKSPILNTSNIQNGFKLSVSVFDLFSSVVIRYSIHFLQVSISIPEIFSLKFFPKYNSLHDESFFLCYELSESQLLFFCFLNAVSLIQDFYNDFLDNTLFSFLYFFKKISAFISTFTIILSIINFHPIFTPRV